MKKIIIVSLLIIALLVIAGGVFWWQSQAEVRDLNKSLPSGVKVVKSLFGSDYTVVNKIDGYEFKVPKVWGGIEEIEYMPERIEQAYTATSINLRGKVGGSRVVSIDRFNNDEFSGDLKSWAKTNFETFGLVGNFFQDKVGNLAVVKTTEDLHLLGMNVYFFKEKSFIYVITNGSEEFIHEIILSGKW